MRHQFAIAKTLSYTISFVINFSVQLYNTLRERKVPFCLLCYPSTYSAKFQARRWPSSSDKKSRQQAQIPCCDSSPLLIYLRSSHWQQASRLIWLCSNSTRESKKKSELAFEWLSTLKDRLSSSTCKWINDSSKTMGSTLTNQDIIHYGFLTSTWGSHSLEKTVTDIRREQKLRYSMIYKLNTGLGLCLLLFYYCEGIPRARQFIKGSI